MSPRRPDAPAWLLHAAAADAARRRAISALLPPTLRIILFMPHAFADGRYFRRRHHTPSMPSDISMPLRCTTRRRASMPRRC